MKGNSRSSSSRRHERVVKHSISRGARAPEPPARQSGSKAARRHRHSWSAAEERWLGRQPDEEVARRLGRSIIAVKARRWHLGITSSPPRWTKEEDRLLGRRPDAEVARRLGRSVAGVQGRRLKLGLRSRPNRHWTKAEERLIGSGSDAEVARRLGRSRRAVEGHRLKLGLRQHPNPRWTEAEERLLAQAWNGPRRKSLTRDLSKKLGRSQASIEMHRRLRFGRVQRRPRPWTPREDRLLGTRMDSEVARLLDRERSTVSTRRARLGIPPFVERRPWTPAQDRLLGTASDEALTKKLGRSRTTIGLRRQKLGIARFARAGAWGAKEERLLGTVPDRELARRLGRTPTAVQARRILKRIPSVLSRGRRWTAREDALLGTKSDAEIGRLLGRGLPGIRRRRRLLHIRLTQWPSGKTIARKWTQPEVQLLGRLPDTEVAERTGRKLRSVIGKRWSLGRPPCASKVRRVSRRPSVIPIRRSGPWPRN